MTGVIPAIPVILIRPFLPESPIWKEKRAAGTLQRPSIAELFAPQYRRTTLVTTLMFAMAYGAAFGAINQIPKRQLFDPHRHHRGHRGAQRGSVTLRGLCGSVPQLAD